jgi:hypothetical protein
MGSFSGEVKVEATDMSLCHVGGLRPGPALTAPLACPLRQTTRPACIHRSVVKSDQGIQVIS